MAGWEEGVAAFKTGNYQEAANQFQAFIEEAASLGAAENPEYAPAYFMLGQSLYKLGKPKDAIEPLKTALQLKSDDANTQLVLGQAYFKLGDYRNAVSVLSKMDTASVPEAHRAVISKLLAVSYQKTGQEGLALANLEKAAQLNPNDAATQFNYGTRALAAGYTDDAVKALAKAVSLDGNDPDKQRAYVRALVRQGREAQDRATKRAVYGKAAAAAQKLVQLESSYDNLLTLAEAQLGAQQYDPALATLKQAAAKNSSDWLPYFYMGQAHTAKGTFEQAVQPLKTALGKPNADQQRVWRQLGFVYEKQKKFGDAKTAYNNAGDSASAARVEENQRIQEENLRIEEENRRIEELERQRKELEKEMKQLPGSP